MTRLMLLVVLVIFLPALLVALLLVRAAEPTPVVRVQTTSATTWPTDSWTRFTIPETTTTTARPVAKARTAPTADVHVGDIPALIRAGFARFGADIAEQAVRVSFCETAETFDPGSEGDAGERGLFQLHPVHRGWIDARGFGWDRMYEAGPNIEAAAALYEQEGWRPWTCRYAA